MKAWTDVFREALKGAADSYVQQPLWNFPPRHRNAVLSERRVRFGIEDERINPDDLTEEDE